MIETDPTLVIMYSRPYNGEAKCSDGTTMEEIFYGYVVIYSVTPTKLFMEIVDNIEYPLSKAGVVYFDHSKNKNYFEYKHDGKSSTTVSSGVYNSNGFDINHKSKIRGVRIDFETKEEYTYTCNSEISEAIIRL